MDRSATISLAVDPALIEAASGIGVDLAEVFDRALKRELALRARSLPLSPDEREAIARSIEASNRHLEEHGLFSDEWRTF